MSENINDKAINLLITSVSNDDLVIILEAILEKYPNKFNKEYTDKLFKGLTRYYGSNIDPEQVFRELKNLITECFFNRLSKKYKAELISKNGLDEERINVVFETLNQYKSNIEGEADNSNCCEIKNFEIITSMPISSTNNNLVEETNEFTTKEDGKQQELTLRLEISKEDVTKSKKKNSDNKNALSEELKIPEITEIVEMKFNKKKLVSVFEELEKLQEKLDELY